MFQHGYYGSADKKRVMTMAEKKNRRSFVVDLMSSAAGVWLVATGGISLTALVTGCSDDDNTPKYGGVPPKDSGPIVKYGGNDGFMRDKYGGMPDGAVVKYGGQPDAAVVKYGGQPDMAMTKYGGNPDMTVNPDGAPAVKYGGIKLDGAVVKYGGQPDASVSTPKYGGQPDSGYGKKYGGQPS